MMRVEYGDDDRYMVLGRPLFDVALEKFPNAGHITVCRGDRVFGGVSRAGDGPAVIWDMSAGPSRRYLLPRFLRIGGRIEHGKDEVTRYWRIGRFAFVVRTKAGVPCSARVSLNFDYRAWV